MHNNIMTGGSRDRPPVLATGRYAQCPYIPSTVIIPVVPATYDSPVVLERTSVEIILNIIRDEIYSTIDASKTTHNMWIAIERLQWGESLNIQDVKTNLFWDFDRFIYHDEELMESYYSRFYKMMNEMIRDKLTIATIEIAKPITPSSESASEEDRDPKQAQRDKDMKKLSTHCKIGQFGNQRTVIVDEARETVGSQVQYNAEYNVFANERQHFKQPESISNTCVMDKVDSNIIPDSPNMCDNDIQTDQNAEVKRAALANLIVNLTLDNEKNKKILKQLKKANASLTQELKECKSNLEESNNTRDGCLIALQCKQTKLEKYMAFNDRTIDYDKLERKLNETLGLLAQKEIDIKKGLKLKAYEILVVKEKHDELVKQSLLTKSHYKGLIKEKTKVITDLKSKEETTLTQ
ncbi:hypothetical protein Tco_0469115 [Tanacetum coccineum]